MAGIFFGWTDPSERYLETCAPSQEKSDRVSRMGIGGAGAAAKAPCPEVAAPTMAGGGWG